MFFKTPYPGETFLEGQLLSVTSSWFLFQNICKILSTESVKLCLGWSGVSAYDTKKAGIEHLLGLLWSESLVYEDFGFPRRVDQVIDDISTVIKSSPQYYSGRMNEHCPPFHGWKSFQVVL